MNPVRRWTLFLRAVVVAIGILVLGTYAFRIGVIEDQRLALWPTFGILDLDRIQGQWPVSTVALVASVQVVIWTLLSYLLFVGYDGFRRSGSRRP